MANRLRCDGDNGCGQEFEPSYKSTMNGEVEKLHFTCPHCGKLYVISYTDDECRKMQRKIARAQHELGERLASLKKKYLAIEHPELAAKS